MTTTPTPPLAGTTDLHAAIMNIPHRMPITKYAVGTEAFIAYKEGHRDARHAAAELVAAAEAAAPQSVSVPEALSKWAGLIELADTEWAQGYEAARRYVKIQLECAAPAALLPQPQADAGSIRDHADFREDLERLSEPGLSKAQAKIIRKSIYDTIDARVRNLSIPPQQGEGSIDSGKFRGLAYTFALRFANNEDKGNAALDTLIAHIDTKLSARLARTAAPSEQPPGTRPCNACEGKGVIHQCVICGSSEPGTGTCGSDDPRALCKFTASAALKGADAAEIASFQWMADQQVNGRAVSNRTREAYMESLLAIGLVDAPAPLEAPPIPTGLSKRLRALAAAEDGKWCKTVITNPELMRAAADEIDRYYGGMVALKEAAEAKDAELAASLRASAEVAEDADRYIFARNHGYFSAPLLPADITYERALDIDFAIDAVRAALAKKGQP